MTTIIDQVGLLEAERDRYRQENETLKTRIAKLAGGNAANERTIMFLESRIEKHIEFNTTVKHLLHSILGTRDTVVQQQAELAKAEHAAAPVVATAVGEEASVPPPDTGMKSLMRRLRASEAPLNGHAA